MTPHEFVRKYAPHANEVAVKLGVPSLVTLSQAALESQWGKHSPQYNFFGMTGTYNGEYQLLWTREYKNGEYVRVQRKFRAYPSATHAFADYANNLASKAQFADAFQYKHNPEKFLYEIASNGYATEPNYYNLVLTIMKMIKKYVV